MATVGQTVTYSVSNNGTPAGTYGSWSVAPGTAGTDWNMIPVSNSGLNSIQVQWLSTTFSPYTVAVTATNSCSNLLASKQETVTSGGCTDVAPSNLTADTDANNKVSLNWTDNSFNETGFEIEYSTDNTSWIAFGTESANTTQNFSTPGAIQHNTLYFFRVRNIGTCNSNWSNTAQVIVAPETPQAFSTNATGSIFQLNLSWSDINPNTGINAVTYDIEAARNNSPCMSTNFRTITTVGGLSHTIANLKANSPGNGETNNPYSVRVRSRNVNNVVSNWVSLFNQTPTLALGGFIDNDPGACAYWTN
jgi:hypothetical protein